MVRSSQRKAVDRIPPVRCHPKQVGAFAIEMPTHWAALFVPNALAAPFAFEKANCLSLLGVEELVGELKGCGTRRAVQKPISIARLQAIVHAPFLPTGR